MIFKAVINLFKDIYNTDKRNNELRNLYVNTYYPKTLGTNLTKGERND